MKNYVQADFAELMVLDQIPEEIEATPLECAVGVMAYNEEANIANVLERLLQQKTSRVKVREIIVVASGCTDNTVAIARRFEGPDSLIRVLEQPRREGKASAINLFLQHTNAEIVMLVNGDNLPREDTVENMVAPFHDPEIGMTGGHAVPLNTTDYFMGFAVNLLWSLHDEIARHNPKLGEVVAWRRSIGFIPRETAVDELSLEMLVTEQGFELSYQPEAIVYNRGPETVSDFLKQRRRIHAGHLQVLNTHGYRAATLDGATIVRALLSKAKWEARWLTWTAGTVALEVIGRTLGSLDFYTKKKHTVWQRVDTTKVLLPQGNSDLIG
jgi:cellulose synthase/poly-beta-1,6-N-acetylglucosamine synthase-like glycosyltransferase